MRRIALLLVALLPACETNFTTGKPIWALATMTASDGSKSWRFVGPWRLNSNEDELASAIAFKLGEAHWCPNGWDISSRQKEMDRLVVEGRCKSG